MRWFLGILATVIFLAASAMSWGHSKQFFAQNGYGGGLDPLLGVILLESLFLMGAGAEIYHKKNGEKSTASVKLALWLGGGTVLWANLRFGLNHGVEGVAAGLIIVAALLVAESILADVVLAVQKSKAGESPADREEPPERETVSKSSPVDQTAAGDPPADRENPGEIAPGEAGGAGDSPASREKSGDDSSADRETAVGGSPVLELAPPPPPAEIARRIYDREGKWPGRRRLAKEAGISEHQARLVLDDIKPTEEKSKSA